MGIWQRVGSVHVEFETQLDIQVEMSICCWCWRSGTQEMILNLDMQTYQPFV